MVFTTTLFLYFFFPITITLWLLGKGIDYRTKKTRMADIMLVIVSFIFFGWNNYESIFWMLVFVGVVYIDGLLIEQASIAENERISKYAFVSGVSILLILLGYYKYRAFSLEIINQIFESDIIVKSVLTPLGISFITFTAISYLTDIKMQKAKAGSFLDCAPYISFFPKLVSRPIVLWRNFEREI